MTSLRSVAHAIAASGVVLACANARADDRVASPEPIDVGESAHIVLIPPSAASTAPTPPAPSPAPRPAAVATARAPSAAVITPRKQPTGTFTIGAGYDSDEGFLATAKVAQSDLFGTGHGLSLSADVSKLSQNFVMAYDIPKLGGGWDLHTELAARQRHYPGFTRDSARGAIVLGKQLTRSTRAYVKYRAELVEVTPEEAPDGVSKMARRLAGDIGNGFVSAVGAGIAYDTRDSQTLPMMGNRLELSAEQADRRLGSDYDFMKLSASADHARPLGPFTLRLSGRASYVESRDPGGVPLAHRLFHDGNTDIRGYRIGSLAGWNQGANFEGLGRLELELPVWKRAGLSIAGFFDAGFHSNNDASWGPVGGALHRAVGLSLIWRSPIGVLRFDVAFPLDGADRDRAFLFGIGGGF